MAIWIPPQQYELKKQLRWATVSAFVVAMAWLMSFFYDEYQAAEKRKVEAQQKITEIHEYNQKVEAQEKALAAPPPESKKQRIIIRDKSTEEPTGGAPPPPELPRATPAEAVKSIPGLPKVGSSGDSKIEIDAGLIKVAMSNEASWMAILKIVFTVLGTFFGIRLINFGFKKLEGEPKPA